MIVTLIAAVAEGGVIGRQGGLPWRLPADLRHFKEATLGHHLVVGRRTWESIGRALPGRRMIVVSRGTPPLPAGVTLAGSLDAALALAQAAGETETFVAGGGEIYRAALPRADRLAITRVQAVIPGDVTFPAVDPDAWRRVSVAARPADEANPWPLAFEVWERVDVGG